MVILVVLPGRGINNYNVRGIIIAKEKDERLGYALKLMPNVNLFLYNVFFDIKKII